MLKKIKKWGNSLALRIPKREAEQLNLHENKEVEVEKEGNKLSIKPAQDSLKELLKGVTEENIPSSQFPNDEPQGKEIW